MQVSQHEQQERADDGSEITELSYDLNWEEKH